MKLRTLLRCSFSVLYLGQILFTVSLLPLLYAHTVNDGTNEHRIPELLSHNSVVLITGAATHLGSQLAMALFRTYNVSKLILVDELNANDIYLPPNHLTKLSEQFLNKPPVEQRIRSEKSLAAFEFKRQRIFHVMQTLQSRGYFYRVDFRPVLPEYSGTPTETPMLGLPVLNMIFEEHDITHVVHLDENVLDPNFPPRVISRRKEDDRMGMMDALLEQLKLSKEKSFNGSSSPQFVFASSGDIYDGGPEPKREDWNISFSSSSSIQGTAKLLDEILARSYNDLYGVYSIGLRFFEIYGPWSSPGTRIFELAERAISNDIPIIAQSISQESDFHDLKDYVYIDDAIDIILSAMQFKAPSRQNLVVNVGNGEGFPVTAIAQMMERYFPRQIDEHRTDAILETIEPSTHQSTRIASIERARALFGFEPQVSFEDGIKKTLAWHLDRAFPFDLSTKGTTTERLEVINSGIQSCHLSDIECLNGLTVFPCVSECARSEKCKPSIYDSVAKISKVITKTCEAVMYTIDLRKDINGIRSAFVNLSSEDQPSFNGDFCNIAFVREDSDLTKRLKQNTGIYNNDVNVENELLRKLLAGLEITKADVLSFGFWTILPLSTAIIEKEAASTAYFENTKMIPKLSPGSFFSSKYAIYCDPNVAFTNVPALLRRFVDDNERSRDSSTVMMLGTKIDGFYAAPQFSSIEGYNQERMYNTISMALKHNSGIQANIDSSWMIHSLVSSDARELRCDILGETINWNAKEDLESVQFILSLHDFWSSALAQWRGEGLWWKANGRVESNEENIAVFCGGRERCLVRLLADDQAGAIIAD